MVPANYLHCHRLFEQEVHVFFKMALVVVVFSGK
jgi:hypothetical protein